MGKKKETQGLLDQKTRLIGIAAAGHSVGCTHFSIMLLNYLAGYRRRRAALMEWNSRRPGTAGEGLYGNGAGELCLPGPGGRLF